MLHAEGYHLVAGVDESGRGCLAGPVVAAAAILPGRLNTPWAGEIRDSKLLRPSKRESLASYIRGAAISVGLGVVSHEIIDAQGIARATRLAMKLAVDQLSPRPDYILIDYFSVPEILLPQKGVPDGDSCCFSIACASIITKTARDRLMTQLDRDYPGYGLAQHKGYGTAEHLSCLRRLGPSPIHRRSFRPVGDMNYIYPSKRRAEDDSR